MRKIVVPVTVLALLAGMLPGCAGIEQTTREHPKATVGAGAGAVGGAVVGGLIGGRRGAVVGGLLGALSGGAIGHYLDEQERSRADTERRYGYSPAQGTRLRVEALRADPAALMPGETVDIALTYAVLTPSPDAQILVRETREIRRGDVVVGKTSIDIGREGGTWKSIVPITLPPDAAPGTYHVVASVQSSGGVMDTRETRFTVTE